MKSIYLTFFSIWLLCCIHILYQGLQPYKHYRFDELQTASLSSVLQLCAFFSIYFFIYFLLEITQFRKKYAFLSFFILSCWILYLALLCLFGAMHAPPYFIAFSLNTLFLLFFHFCIYPIILIFNKKTPQ